MTFINSDLVSIEKSSATGVDIQCTGDKMGIDTRARLHPMRMRHPRNHDASIFGIQVEQDHMLRLVVAYKSH